MTTFVWDIKFNTGLETMDAQHQKIFDFMTTIYKAIPDSHLKCDNFNSMLDQLALLCQMYFITEEQLMDEKNYPSAAEHKRQHNLFLATIDQLKIENNQCHTTSILIDFIHIREDFV